MTQLQLGFPAAAIWYFDRALEMNPRYAEAWCSKGAALYNLKRYAEARQALEKAAELGLAQARQALEALRQEGH